MNNLTAITFAGRRFSSEDLALMRQAATDYATLGITEISRTICEWLDWKRPNGRLKNHECRLLLQRLRQEGFLVLPALRHSGRRGPRSVLTDVLSDARSLIQTQVTELEPLRFRLVDASNGSLFRQFIQRYHYLGYRTPVGAHLRYVVESGCGDMLACLLWTSPAWKMTHRDRWIGWNADQRARNLQYIVNNGRFLILPWVRVKGLASSILSRSARLLPQDWQQHYGYTPLLLETFVDAARFTGTCYRAANWICLGETSGRGRMDRHHHRSKLPKRIFVFPLHRRAQQFLCATDPPAPAVSQDE
jgi:hypothetical protein